MVLTHALLALRSAHKASYEATAVVVVLVVVVALVDLVMLHIGSRLIPSAISRP